MADWEDRSSYSQGERGTKDPTIWELERDGIRISVHRWHGLSGWFLTCHALALERIQLASEAAAEAKEEAFAVLRLTLEKQMRTLHSLGVIGGFTFHKRPRRAR